MEGTPHTELAAIRVRLRGRYWAVSCGLHLVSVDPAYAEGDIFRIGLASGFAVDEEAPRVGGAWPADSFSADGVRESGYAERTADWP
jgi:hypothetical protein